jgi:hypothetical protein
MNRQQAKEILALYRPETADAQDPSFAEARRLCESDPELKHWFDAHCAGYTALRARFKQIPIPEALKEQILAERKVHTTPFWRRRTVVLAAVAALTVTTGLVSLWLQPREDTGFPGFRNRMVSTSLRMYRMDLETNDLAQIRNFLSQRNSPADYRLPAALERNARPTGCVVVPWQGEPVSMICFHSGRPLGPGQTSDLFLFVAPSSRIRGAPGATSPALARVNRATTATWSRDGKTYLLIAAGDEELIRKYL